MRTTLPLELERSATVVDHPLLEHFIPLENGRFILLTRDLMQTRVSQTRCRQITTYRYSRNYEQSIQASVLQFFQKNSLPYLTVRFIRVVENSLTIRRIRTYSARAIHKKHDSP